MTLTFSYRKAPQALNYLARQAGGRINKMKALSWCISRIAITCGSLGGPSPMMSTLPWQSFAMIRKPFRLDLGELWPFHPC
jgi:hypothetical protein